MSHATKLNAQMLRSTFKTADARRGETLLSEFLRNRSDDRANYLLRDHRTSEIASYETYPRDQIDQLLSYYSMLFIAIQVGVVDPYEITRELQKIEALLSYAPLKTYFSDIYPIRLPGIFLDFLGTLPLEGVRRMSPRSNDNVRAFFVFFDLSTTFEFDPDVEWFLWIVDSGTRRGWSFARLRETLATPEIAAALFFAEKPNPGQQILRGLLKFLQICRDLDELTTLETSPSGLRILFLSYYEYWFRSARRNLKSDMIANTEQLLGVLASQESDVGTYVDSFRALDRRIAELETSRFVFDGAIDGMAEEAN